MLLGLTNETLIVGDTGHALRVAERAETGALVFVGAGHAAALRWKVSARLGRTLDAILVAVEAAIAFVGASQV